MQNNNINTVITSDVVENKTDMAKRVKVPELLAPAGNFEKMKTAIAYGADAVYLAAQRFGLRASAKNFDETELKQAVKYAHEHAVRVYMTVNAVAREYELADLISFAIEAETYAVDAVIISDPGIFRVFKRYAPSLELHVSTQANVCNSEACMFWYEQGARRIILAREVSLSDIKEMKKQLPTDLDIEVFVHGAMCMAYSGRCLLSAKLNGRSANRGACTQACRWSYKLQEVNRSDEAALPIEEDEHGSFILSSKDISMISHVRELIEAGVDSLKIEGRMKSAYYVAAVTKAYRQELDAYQQGQESKLANAEAMVSSVVHRPYDTGFFFDDPSRSAKVTEYESYLRPLDVMAISLDEEQRARAIAESSQDGTSFESYVAFKQMKKLDICDKLQLFTSDSEASIDVTIEKMLDLDGKEIEVTPHGGQIFFVKMKEAVPSYSFIVRATEEQ